MFNEIQIAHAEYQIRNAKYGNVKEVEGMTARVPNIIDRMVMALRALLRNDAVMGPMTFEVLTHTRPVAEK